MQVRVRRDSGCPLKLRPTIPTSATRTQKEPLPSRHWPTTTSANSPRVSLSTGLSLTEWLYYPDTGGQGLDISLIAEKPLSKDLVTLTCPKVSEGYMPPVKVEYVHDPAYPKSQQITAYAYQARENPVNQRSVLVPSKVVVLTGVTLDTTTMLPSLIEGRKNALIEQRVISRSIPDVATENTTAWKESVVQNSWLGMQRNTLTTSILYDDNPSVGRTVRAEAQGKIISSRIFSRLSGRPLSETRDGLEFRYVHDSLGRLVRQERGTT
ncbi:YD repeat protein [Pseudomonas syringae pv. berberidis]|nr:YD repeat protein [Pseudomonas syringae pv. berberidis]RMP60742.1 YD repeat protein [Pseudomonas syringae pv. berberidis]